MAGNWTNEEKTEIAKTFAVLATIQKTYGREIEIKPTLQAWEFVLSDYSAGQVIHAMCEWMKKDSSMPAPADLIKIINPPKSKISFSEFNHAKDQWRLEGFPSYSYYAGVVKDYEKQESESRAEKPDYPDNLVSIAAASIKKISA